MVRINLCSSFFVFLQFYCLNGIGWAGGDNKKPFKVTKNGFMVNIQGGHYPMFYYFAILSLSYENINVNQCI